MAKFKMLAVVALATGALFVGPAAAQAAYVPAANITVTGTVAAGSTVDVDFAPGSFANGETVSVALTCDTTTTSTETAGADGSLNLDVAIPTGATGTCTLTATGLVSGDIGSVSLTIPAADGTGTGNGTGTGTTGGSGSGVGTVADGADDELAFTGASDSTMLLVWTASGVLLLGVALIVVMKTVRRQRASA